MSPRIAFVASLALVGLLGVAAACDETTNPDCQTQECLVVADGGASDRSAPSAPAEDGAIVNPIPFDAGTTPAPTCKGLFELCSGQECCSPYGCTNGTCR